MGIYVGETKISESIAKLLTVASGHELVADEDGLFYAEPVGSVTKKQLLLFLMSSVAGAHHKLYPLSSVEKDILYSLLDRREIVWG